MPTPNIEDMSANLTLIATKLKKRNKLVKLADRSPVGRSIVQEYEQEPMAGDSDDAQKVREAEQRAIRKRKVKTSASFTVILIHDFQSTRFSVSESQFPE